MYLAKDHKGNIGRQLPKPGLQASVSKTSMGDRHGQLYLSARSIEEDEKHNAEKERQQRARKEAQRFNRIAERRAIEAREKIEAQKAKVRQKLAAYDPNTEKLKLHYAKKSTMGETSQTLESLFANPPADFSQSGANPQYVPGERMRDPVWRADFRDHLIVGNPLTRNGEFGPEITDYDRFVKGVDVNQTDVVEIAGGTMLGRYNDEMAPMGPNGRGYNGKPRAMGFDWSWDGVTDWASDVANQTVDELAAGLPAHLANELKNAVAGGGTVTQGPGGVVYVTQPGGQVQTFASETIPKWALYGGIGLLGVGVLFVMIKALK